MTITSSRRSPALALLDAQRTKLASVPPLRPTASRCPISERQLEIIDLVSEGSSNAAIGRKIGISEDSVKTHLSRAYRRLQAHDRAHVVAICIRAGWV